MPKPRRNPRLRKGRAELPASSLRHMAPHGTPQRDAARAVSAPNLLDVRSVQSLRSATAQPHSDASLRYSSNASATLNHGSGARAAAEAAEAAASAAQEAASTAQQQALAHAEALGAPRPQNKAIASMVSPGGPAFFDAFAVGVRRAMTAPEGTTRQQAATGASCATESRGNVEGGTRRRGKARAEGNVRPARADRSQRRVKRTASAVPRMLDAGRFTVSTAELIHPESAPRTRVPLSRPTSELEYWRKGSSGLGTQSRGATPQLPPPREMTAYTLDSLPGLGVDQKDFPGAQAPGGEDGAGAEEGLAPLGGLPSEPPSAQTSPRGGVWSGAQSRPTTAPGHSDELAEFRALIPEDDGTTIDGESAYGGGVAAAAGFNGFPGAPGSRGYSSLPPSRGALRSREMTPFSAMTGTSFGASGTSGGQSGASSLGPTDDLVENAARLAMARSLLADALKEFGGRAGITASGMERLAQIPDQINRAIFWTGPRPQVVANGGSLSFDARIALDSGDFSALADDNADAAAGARAQVSAMFGERGGGATGLPDGLNGGPAVSDAEAADVGDKTVTPYFELVRVHRERKRRRDADRAYLQGRIRAENGKHGALEAQVAELQAETTSTISQLRRDRVQLSKLEADVTNLTKQARMNEGWVEEAHKDETEARIALFEARAAISEKEAVVADLISRLESVDSKLTDLEEEKKGVLAQVEAMGLTPSIAGSPADGANGDGTLASPRRARSPLAAATGTPRSSAGSPRTSGTPKSGRAPPLLRAASGLF